MIKVYNRREALKIIFPNEKIVEASRIFRDLVDENDAKDSSYSFDFKSLPENGPCWFKIRNKKGNYSVFTEDKYGKSLTLKQTQHPNLSFIYNVRYSEIKGYSLKDVLEYQDGEKAIEFLKERNLKVQI